MFNGGPVTWYSSKQPITALSITQAADCCREMLYLKMLIEELTDAKSSVVLNVGNQSAISLIKTGQMNKKQTYWCQI